VSVVRFLADTSAVVRLLRNPRVQELWQSQVRAGVIGVCAVTELGFLRGTRSKADHDRYAALLGTVFTWVVTPDDVWRRAAEVQQMLADGSEHRGPGAVDLLVAATAELSGLSLLHYDHDFETIARATQQATTWLAAPGSID
jgi:predicted nucleic acid-binding protein